MVSWAATDDWAQAVRDFLMQCFQKDPNLRVTARKLLKHAWIAGCRRSDAAVAKAPSDYDQAVEEVKQWNKALKSSETSLRASTGSDSSGYLPPGHPWSRFNGGDPHRSNLANPGKGPLALAKPKSIPEAFRSPELAGESIASPSACPKAREKAPGGGKV